MLFQEILEAGVYIVPGSELYCVQPGWFRMVVSVSEQEQLIGKKNLNKKDVANMISRKT